MKKQIVLVCSGGQQFGIIVDEISADKIVKQIIRDIMGEVDAGAGFICLSNYVSSENSNPMYIRASMVVAVVVAAMSNIAVPNKHLVVPTGVGPN